MVFLQKFPQYKRQELTKFSKSWLDKFKAYYNIQKFKQHIEVRSVNLEAIEKELQKSKKVITPYTNENIYNIDESPIS